MPVPAGTSVGDVTQAELRLAARNHALPLEALRHDITPAGLHYLLIHYDIPAADPKTWRLEVGGAVKRPLSLSLTDLQALPTVSRVVTLECAGNGRARLDPRPLSQPWLTEAVGTAEWTGVPLATVIDAAGGLAAGTVELVFSGLDRGIEGGVEQVYARSLPVAEALGPDALLAYAMNGAPLPMQHGFPLRLVVAGWYGMAHVKWLGAITAVTERFTGFQQAVGYRLYDADGNPGEPVTRMLPRSLMMPPGIPDFMTRERFLDCGPCRLEGRAWSGWGAIERVRVSVDGGATWLQAELGAQPDPCSWVRWTMDWDARAAGAYVFCSRARDAAGNEQPLEPRWNLKGYANNAVERIPVTVR
jgi:DMSO/TMAO reductase YedYZ molybdopterin-dependent catalytic subunit